MRERERERENTHTESIRKSQHPTDHPHEVQHAAPPLHVHLRRRIRCSRTSNPAQFPTPAPSQDWPHEHTHHSFASPFPRVVSVIIKAIYKLASRARASPGISVPRATAPPEGSGRPMCCRVPVRGEVSSGLGSGVVPFTKSCRKEGRGWGRGLSLRKRRDSGSRRRGGAAQFGQSVNDGGAVVHGDKFGRYGARKVVCIFGKDTSIDINLFLQMTSPAFDSSQSGTLWSFGAGCQLKLIPSAMY